jgi:hypothetical protein
VISSGSWKSSTTLSRATLLGFLHALVASLFLFVLQRRSLAEAPGQGNTASAGEEGLCRGSCLNDHIVFGEVAARYCAQAGLSTLTMQAIEKESHSIAALLVQECDFQSDMCPQGRCLCPSSLPLLLLYCDEFECTGCLRHNLSPVLQVDSLSKRYLDTCPRMSWGQLCGQATLSILVLRSLQVSFVKSFARSRVASLFQCVHIAS